VRISLSLLLLIASVAEAQGRPGALFAQFGAEGLGVSANLDVGLTQSVRLRGGVGYLPFASITFPVSASYLIGRGNATIELGAGATTVITAPDNGQDDGVINDWFEKHFFGFGRDPMVVPLLIAGWRYHPRHSVLLRLTLTPLLLDGKAHLYGGAGVGLTF
jgi:hypothetical protein